MTKAPASNLTGPSATSDGGTKKVMKVVQAAPDKMGQEPGTKSVKKSYEQMMIDAITENDPRRKGISFISIQKFIKGRYLMEGGIKTYVKKAFEKLTEKAIVERVSGTVGINGSIRFTKHHTESVKKQEKQRAAPPAPKKSKRTGAPAKRVMKSDTNNNREDKAAGKPKAKPKPKPKAGKVNPKKTAITKTKIDRSGGKVRLSILPVAAEPTPMRKKKTDKVTRTKKTKQDVAKTAVDDGPKMAAAIAKTRSEPVPKKKR